MAYSGNFIVAWGGGCVVSSRESQTLQLTVSHISSLYHLKRAFIPVIKSPVSEL